jgi:DNA-binding MarR family transcriptional regulator
MVEAVADAPSSVETAELMFGCFKRMHRLVDAELSTCGLSLSRTKLLSELSRNGPQQQSALATTFGLAPRTVTELIDTLERDGLVERRTDPADRRARQVHLTPAGEQTRERAMVIKHQVMDRVLGGLSDRQLTGLAGALHLIEAEIDKIDTGQQSVGSAADSIGAPRL